MLVKYRRILIVNYIDIESKYLGETSKNICKVFEVSKEMNNILFLLESNLTPNLKDAFSKGIENASEPIYKVIFIVIVFFSIICVTILANTLRAEQFVFLFVYAILTIVTEEDRTLCSYVTIAAKHFLLEQQKYLWK